MLNEMRNYVRIFYRENDENELVRVIPQLDSKLLDGLLPVQIETIRLFTYMVVETKLVQECSKVYYTTNLSRRKVAERYGSPGVVDRINRDQQKLHKLFGNIPLSIKLGITYEHIEVNTMRDKLFKYLDSKDISPYPPEIEKTREEYEAELTSLQDEIKEIKEAQRKSIERNRTLNEDLNELRRTPEGELKLKYEGKLNKVLADNNELRKIIDKLSQELQNTVIANGYQHLAEISGIMLPKLKEQGTFGKYDFEYAGKKMEGIVNALIELQSKLYTSSDSGLTLYLIESLAAGHKEIFENDDKLNAMLVSKWQSISAPLLRCSNELRKQIQN